MRTRIVLAVVLTSLALVTMTGAAQAALPVTGATSNNSSLAGTYAVALSGHYAYAVAYWSGQLSVFDVSNPNANPVPVASTPSQSTMFAATNITIAGNFAFVTSKNRNGPCKPGPQPSCTAGSDDDGTGDSLTVVDISNPLSPKVVGSVRDIQKLFGAYAVAVSGHYAFVASQGQLSNPGYPTGPSTSTGSFSVIDLSNLGAGVIANIDNASLTGPLANGLQHATGVAISGNYAYVTAYYGHSLTVIDISKPTSPVARVSVHDANALAGPDDVAISGNYAYVANQLASSSKLPDLTTVNISNPLSPTVTGALTDPALSGAYRVRVHGTHAYVSGNNVATIGIVDISNPAAPKLTGAFGDATKLANVTGLDVAANGEYVVAVSPRGGTGLLGANFFYAPYPAPGASNLPIGTISIMDLTAGNTAAPAITGKAQTGHTLTLSNGTWPNATSFSYVWLRCPTANTGCTIIPGQTGNTYKASPGDVGQRLSAIVFANSALASASAIAAPTAVVSWSTAAFASGSLHYRKSVGASLSLAVPNPGGGLTLSKLAITLPKGVSFVGRAKSLARGFSVRSGKKVKFKLSLSHGRVTLTFSKPPTGVTIRVPAKSVSLSSKLAKRVTSHKVKSLSGGLSATYLATQTPRSGTVKYRVK
jgi:hypothetical protein